MPRQTPPTLLIPTRAELEVAVALGHVARHDLDGLSLYNYTSQCVYDRGWTPTTIAARGILYRGEVLVALPFPKFFNHNEPDAVIPDGPPTGATVKVDGVLGISYRHRGQVRWTTRGRLDSPPSGSAQRLWDAQHPQVEVPLDWTLLAEIVTPETKIIIDYDGLERLVVLGARQLDGGYVSRLVLADWCAQHGLSLVSTVPSPSFGQLRTQSGTLSPEFEGWVLEWGTHRLKVKGTAYLQIARLLQGMTPRFAADLWVEQVPMAALMRLPEETRGWLAEEWATLDERADAVASEAAEIVRNTPEWRSDRRGFVASLTPKHPLFSALMEWWDGDEPDWRQWVYKAIYRRTPRPTGVLGPL